ncbi:hypothetical protein LL033_10010 [Clostridium estertheticum]|uniref:hypothetical protein n=1 Tax=Clostridium estertheticum TaxID=238834 RepID=UPI001C0C59C6|nr:hypothetical protein [Clostridium estertheticum]MBU3217803.1 hypothetical protein [Clostridium estertheticum]WAG57490.1 hypothetical protein LL033_10010 [Clostridium estertheticum]
MYLSKYEYNESETRLLNINGFTKEYMNPQVLGRIIRKKKNKEKSQKRKAFYYKNRVDKQNRMDYCKINKLKGEITMKIIKTSY